MAFGMYADELMTQAITNKSLVFQSDLSNAQQDFIVYFGAPGAGTKLQTVNNPGNDDIKLIPTDITPKHMIATAYNVGDVVEPDPQNFYCYECITAGTSADTAPDWNIGIGSEVQDGPVLWRCVAKTHEPAEIKLALSASGLNTATAGGELVIGKTLKSGASTAIHVRITNTVDTPFSTVNRPQISIHTNDVTETGA